MKGLQIEVKEVKLSRKENTKTLASFRATVLVDGKPVITLPNYRLVMTDQGLKVDAAIHKTVKKEGKPTEFIKCYYPFAELNSEILPQAEKQYLALKQKTGK